MNDGTRSVAEITQLADQLIDVAHGLLEFAGGKPAGTSERIASVPTFRAEMRRYNANGDFVDLSEIEARILDTLLRSRGSLVTKSQLCQVLGLDPDRQERNLKSYVYRLKAKLNRMEQPGVKIRPIHGAGYVLSEVSASRSPISA